ncbi:MAG: VOC family protein [Candidatus Saccharibacteria bacterium]
MANQVDYFEIGSSDPAASQAFYSGLFGWDIAEKPSEQGYRAINKMAGGLWDSSKMGNLNYAIIYINVDDVAATIKKAESLGATVALPYTSGGGIDFAHLVDPLGNRFGVWKPTN